VWVPEISSGGNDQGIPSLFVHATRWEIEVNSVGNGFDQVAVGPAQPGSVGSPPWGTDRTGGFASTKLVAEAVPEDLNQADYFPGRRSSHE